MNQKKPKAAAGARVKAGAADRPITGRDFDRLTDAEKEAVYREATAIRPEDGRPLTPAQRRRWAGMTRKKGRPMTGRGAARVQITVERGLLARADAHARSAGLTRSQLVARGLEFMVP